MFCMDEYKTSNGNSAKDYIYKIRKRQKYERMKSDPSKLIKAGNMHYDYEDKEDPYTLNPQHYE